MVLSALSCRGPWFTARLVAERQLRFSERKRLAETGSLGDLQDAPSPELRRAIAHALDRTRNALRPEVRDGYTATAQDTCEEHFGWSEETVMSYPRVAPTTEDFLDYLEILVEAGSVAFSYRVPHGRDYITRQGTGWPDAEAELNALFERHRFGFRIQDGEAHAVASPALDEAVVGPTLIALERPGWEEAERSFREALVHQRGPASENDDALRAANAALEAALKAMGLEGSTLGQLGKSLSASRYVPGQLAEVPEMLDDLLQRCNALRNIHGDAHGKAPGASDVPQSLVNLAIHLTGSFIVYLAESEGEAVHH